jgi:hypothetical protein
MKTITRKCLVCDLEFNAPIREVNRGNGKVCSRDCARKRARQSNIKHHTPNVKCSFCNKEFYLSASKMKNSKSGLYFCCREHKDLGQRISSGINDIHPPHYKSGKYGEYRKYAIQHYGSLCQLCGYNKYEGVLEVHHKDYNRLNNDINNLIVCCANCHKEQHLINGKVIYQYKDLLSGG